MTLVLMGGGILYKETPHVNPMPPISFNYNKKINPTCPTKPAYRKTPWYLIQEKCPCLLPFQPSSKISVFDLPRHKIKNAGVPTRLSSNASELAQAQLQKEKLSIHLALVLVPHLETSRNGDALLDPFETLYIFQWTSAHAYFLEQALDALSSAVPLATAT
jgi:hypothetical protein